MLEVDFIPNFIYQSTSGNISNNKSMILQYKNLYFISYNNTLNIWNFKTSTLVKSLRHKKYNISYFDISDSLLFVGFSSGLIQVYKLNNDFEKYLEYKIHTKRIINIVLENNLLISASADGLLMKYDLDFERGTCILQTSPLDVFDYKYKIFGIATGDATFTTIKNDKEHAIILDNRLKYLFILDDYSFLFIFRNNDVKIYDSSTDTYKEIKKLKKIKSAKRIDGKIFILGEKKLFSFIIKRNKNEFCLEEQKVVDINSNSIDFYVCNQTSCFITADNSFFSGKLKLEFHCKPITDLKRDKNDRICTLSKDKFIVWNVCTNTFICYNQIKLSEGLVFDVFSSYYVIGENNRILFVNFNDLKIFKILDNDVREKNCVQISVSEYSKNFNEQKNEILGIAINQKINFYDTNIDFLDSLDLPDYVSSFKIYNNFYFVGLLNSKVYIYDKNKDLIKTLYGHSLPVTNINLSDKLIYTIGADKMLKIWGLDFGDCRKSIIANDSINLQILSDNLFIIGSTNLKYYIGYKIYYEKKYFDSNLLLLCKDFLIGANGNSISLYEIDKYELEKINEISEESEILTTNNINIINTSKYEEFIDILEDKNNYIKFNKFICGIGLGDLDSYLTLLSATQIYSLIDLLFQCKNTIVASRIFCTLISMHKDIIMGYKRCDELRENLCIKMKDIRDKLGKNTYKIIFKTGEKI